MQYLCCIENKLDKNTTFNIISKSSKHKFGEQYLGCIENKLDKKFIILFFAEPGIFAYVSAATKQKGKKASS